MTDNKTITIENALQLESTIFLDVRSPSEFACGHIPGAISVPLFDDVERAQVGTLYRTDGSDQAKMLGLQLASAKLPEIIQQIRKLTNQGHNLVVYCWRGGSRSKSVVSILQLMDISAQQVIGGYKCYRNYVLKKLAEITIPPVVVLCGSTGVGKTTLLEFLDQQGVPVLDLEQLANHRGSAFGHVGLGLSQTAQNFDALLLSELERLSTQPYLLVECESKRIGNVYLPNSLFEAMQQGIRIRITADLETRITRLTDEYMPPDTTHEGEFIKCLESLKKRIGTEKIQRLIHLFKEGDFREVARILLVDYYDHLYGYESASSDQFAFSTDADHIDLAGEQIIQFIDKWRRGQVANCR
jgi:tRNA 2-selenouridine synthase